MFPNRILAATCAASLVSLAAGQDWYLEQPGNAPPARRFHGMGFDPLRRVAVLFGGTDERTPAVFGDTWEYDGTTWSQRAVAGPPARERFASCFDTARDVFVVFGGASASGQPLGDTWEYDGAQWTARAPAVAPAARLGAAMAFAADTGRAVLFGGRGTDPAQPFGDTWEYDGADWLPAPVRRLVPIQPAPRHGHAMTFDARRGVVVLFGGFASGATHFDRDTWEYSGSLWSEAFPATLPSPSVFPSLTWHGQHQVAVLTGSTGSASQRVQTWAWDGSDWQPGPAAPGAFGGRQAHATVYDSSRDAVVLFGGARIALAGAQPLDETWELSVQAGFAPFGSGCTGQAGVPVLAPRGGSLPRIGGVFELEVAPIAPAVLPVLLLGFDVTQFQGQPLPLDLSAHGMPGCGLLVAPVLVGGMQAGAGGGAATAAVALPLRTDLVGLSFVAQAFVLGSDASGAMSNAGTVMVGN